MIVVQVRGNNVDQALRVLKKKLQREGVFRDARLHERFETRSAKRRRKKSEAMTRIKKKERKRRERDMGILSSRQRAETPPPRRRTEIAWPGPT
jgi:small subunit ribosomal protein S21